MLGVAVDHGVPEAVFRVSEGAIPVEVAAHGTPWQSVVAVEQTRPIPPTPGPLARATLIPRESGCVVVLTFAHQIADGVGGLRALLDLVAALGGEELPPAFSPPTSTAGPCVSRPRVIRLSAPPGACPSPSSVAHSHGSSDIGRPTRTCTTGDSLTRDLTKM